MDTIKLSNLIFEMVMKTELPADEVLSITGDGSGIFLEISKNGEGVVGTMYLKLNEYIDIWEVREVSAHEGYGPLLYDVALELVSPGIGFMNSQGLMPDNTEVSSDAGYVWKKYFEERKDVKHKLLPVKNRSPYYEERKLKRPWLNYYYQKKTLTRIPHLKALGQLKWNDFRWD